MDEGRFPCSSHSDCDDSHWFLFVRRHRCLHDELVGNLKNEGPSRDSENLDMDWNPRTSEAPSCPGCPGLPNDNTAKQHAEINLNVVNEPAVHNSAGICAIPLSISNVRVFPWQSIANIANMPNDIVPIAPIASGKSEKYLNRLKSYLQLWTNKVN